VKEVDSLDSRRTVCWDTREGCRQSINETSTLSCQLEDVPRHLGLWLSPVGSGWSLVGPMKRRMGRALGVGPVQRAVVG